MKNRRSQCLSLLLFLTVLAAASALAAEKAKAATASEFDTIFKPIKFREVGPATMGGRIDDFAVVERDPDIIYVGTASGGVFKTVNGGTTWTPVFDNEATSSIGAVAVAPSDPSIVWVGTGESNNRQSSSWGNGVFKSTDAGKTWQQMGLAPTHHIGRIVVSPADPNVVYVAATGDLWGPSKDRGVYKTGDGGRTWTNVLFVNDDTGATDVAMDPQSPGTLIAAMYQRRRTVFGFNGSGPGSGMYKTTDGGATWKKLEKGLPWDTTPPEPPQARSAGDDFGPPAPPRAPAKPKLDAEAVNQTGRIGVAFYRRDGNVVYALVEHAAGGVFRSDDAGETWTKMSDTNPRASYYSQIRIDPNNDQRLWVHGANMFTSEDGGKTFTQSLVQKIHGDFHAMWIDPRDSNHMIAGSDGGIHFTRDRGRTWEFDNIVPLGQFYEIGLDNQRPYRICGGLQDNNAWCGPSMTFDNRGIANSDWFTVGGGDGFYAQIDPTDPNIVYAESQDGNLLRRDLRTHQSRSIRPPAPEGERYRFQWNSPVVVSSFDPKTIYYGGNYLFKSTDRGDNWTRLGADLTSGQERDKLPIMGRVPDKYTLSRHDGVQAWPAITTVSESPLNRDLLYVGTDDGNLQVTRDGGKTWKNVAERAKGVPKGTYVSRVVASRHNEATAFATFDGHRSSDFTPYVYVTNDYGETWKPIRNGLPSTDDIVHVIREDFRNPKLLFLGTERALYVSNDQGGRWNRLKLNLPTVPVDDIAIHPREGDLVLATHGRSLWILDDITPVVQMTDAVPSQELHVFDIRPATEWRLANRGGNTGHQLFLGANPPNGAIVNYYLKAKPAEKEKVRITISDKDGKEIREIEGTGEPGVNRVIWDLKTRAVTEPPAGPRRSARPAAPPASAAAASAPSAGAPGAPSPAVTTAGGAPEAETAAPGGPSAEAAEAEQPTPGFRGFRGGLYVEPGQYTVKVAVGNNEQSKTVTVEEDPRITIGAEDRAVRRQALTQLADMAGSATAAQRSITSLRTALNSAIESWKRPSASKPPANVVKSAEDLLAQVDVTCRKLASPTQCGEKAAALGAAGPPLVYTPPSITQRVTQLLTGIENYVAPPTAWQLDQVKLLQGMLTDASAATRKIAQQDLPALNRMMNEAGVPHIVPAPARARTADTAGDEESR